MQMFVRNSLVPPCTFYHCFVLYFTRGGIYSRIPYLHEGRRGVTSNTLCGDLEEKFVTECMNLTSKVVLGLAG